MQTGTIASQPPASQEPGGIANRKTVRHGSSRTSCWHNRRPCERSVCATDACLIHLHHALWSTCTVLAVAMPDGSIRRSLRAHENLRDCLDPAIRAALGDNSPAEAEPLARQPWRLCDLQG